MTKQSIKSNFSLHKELKKHMKIQGITAAELTRKTGIPKSVISDWLAGAQPRNIAQVKLVADYFGISIEALCFGDSAFSPSKDSPWIEGVFQGRIKFLRSS